METTRDEIENQLIKNTTDEGVGSVYERIMLKRFFQKLVKDLDFNTVLEFQAAITKGYDNITFLDNQKQVHVTDSDTEKIKSEWKFETDPVFISPNNIEQKYDLVWNFAILQNQPQVIHDMIQKTNKYILIFTPNFLNWGTPWHLGYHFITQTKCQHAERGKVGLRTKIGLQNYLQAKGIKKISSGYIDMPPLPDIGFSIREFQETVFKKKFSPEERQSPLQPKDLSQTLEKWTFIENRQWLRFTHPIIAHHIYYLGEI